MNTRAAFGLPFLLLKSMHLYQQVSGKWIRADSELIGIGYAGHGAGVNNPAMQEEPFVGPLPVGLYNIGPAYTHPHLGELTMNLTPFDDQLMFGRNNFRIHGDSVIYAGQRKGSDGCIVQSKDVRKEISQSQDRVLKVVSGL